MQPCQKSSRGVMKHAVPTCVILQHTRPMLQRHAHCDGIGTPQPRVRRNERGGVTMPGPLSIPIHTNEPSTTGTHTSPIIVAVLPSPAPSCTPARSTIRCHACHYVTRHTCYERFLWVVGGGGYRTSMLHCTLHIAKPNSMLRARRVTYSNDPTTG